MAANRVPRPEQMVINADAWRIIWFTEDEWYQHHLDDEGDALTYGRERIIYMRTSGPNILEQYYQGLLCHELVHACIHTSGHGTLEPVKDMSATNDIEELFAGVLGPMLLSVLKMNPPVVKYLMSDGTVRRDV